MDGGLLRLHFFNPPAFKIGEIGDLPFVFPFPSAEVEVYFDFFVELDVLQQVAPVLNELDFHEIVPLRILFVFHLDDEFPFLETVADALRVFFLD